jgi:hypothetical protein
MQPTRLTSLEIRPTRGNLNAVVGAHSSLTVNGNLVALTDALTPVFNVAIAPGGTAGGIIFATIEAGNGTDAQSLTKVATFAAVNKGGTITATFTDVTGADAFAASVTLTTLTVAWTETPHTGYFTVNLTPAGSLTETMYDVSFFVLLMTGGGVTPL